MTTPTCWRASESTHFFRYCFSSSATGGDAEFTDNAHADLDCDGVWSTFERSGQAKQGDGCAVRGFATSFKDKPNE